MNNLKIKILNQTFSHPLFLPSGIITEIPGHKIAVTAGVSAVVLKSVTKEAREGNPIPRVAKYKYGFINSVGLRNPGLVRAKQPIKEFIKSTDIPVIVSVFASKIKDFPILVEEMAELNPAAIELNLSCPNVEDDMGQFVSADKNSSYKATYLSRKVSRKIPLICKLSPNPANIGEIAKACEAAGADAISAINSVSQGMIINIKTKKPVLGMKKGGVTGPGIKPIAIAKVYEIYEAVKIPILGMGGVTGFEDVIEMMMAGATLVGIGSAVYLSGYGLYKDILAGLRSYMKSEKIKNIKDIIGTAHHN